MTRQNRPSPWLVRSRGLKPFIDPRLKAEFFPTGLEPLRAWLDAGWRPGAPPYDRISSDDVWRRFLGRTDSLSSARRSVIVDALTRLGWKNAGRLGFIRSEE